MVTLETAAQVLTVEDIVNTSHLKRWHLIRVQREQTLAEHHYLVAMLAAKMYVAINQGPPTRLAEIVAAALLHDVSELKFGDIPAHPAALAHTKELLGGKSLGDLQEEAYWIEKFQQSELSLSDSAILAFIKIADKLDALIFFVLNGDPRTYNDRQVPEGMVSSTIKAFRGFHQDHAHQLGVDRLRLAHWLSHEMLKWVGRQNGNFDASHRVNAEAMIREFIQSFNHHMSTAA